MLGVIAAVRQNSIVDYGVTAVGTLGLTVPSWVIGTWLILIFSIRFDVLPSGGWGSWQNYIMPVFAFSLAPTALVARYTRFSLLETMRADHVRTARAKGLSERRVMASHVAAMPQYPG